MSDRSSPPHVIRLRFPWSVESLGNGLQRFSRHFNGPSGLTNGDRVELVLARVPSPIDVELNGSPLGELDPEGQIVRFAVTDLLEPRNRVDITMAEPSPQAAGGVTERGGRHIEPLFDVSLEIFSL